MADLRELMEEFDEEHGTGRAEGRQGVENLCRLVHAIGYKDRQYFGQFHPYGSFGDLIEFLEDNSGAIEALREWIAEQDQPEWREEIETYLTEKDEEEEDGDEE
jgi:hypothetical protein